ncbi:multifunctional CCA tRNA nucleotidyl transferase/2'3'-cyclic phosphodiesterase/2'nucleotidase/phosphatase [Massilia forsythiae]|uniref:CCA-adding enzyme n=1 Tax=Massilia forsythiae TaxID=2728020 RepID=A0A7Z2W1T4_9BURK|nr:multifunctional CCA tRNA nucleotidyl transferase/2'3'-cyclic phosphodiesterase/2'nucleotidase/phosphatase [Massilia forsythiae]QJE03228.1 multifunctional CCA tRNA nucleotidyl transferase/2'3'-cyclic phosphodiesterase/2'nucleotidase/phosphatase [Massilia forsythiae]
MRSYIVGGAVRDDLLGLPVKDRDWVVVGATPEQMVAQGFRPVGKDFPVFLHPHTQEEYALARTERKTAPGYHGFVFHTAPEVTLEDDLVRRDLTINAMARAEDGGIVDPYGGLRDLQDKVFRHVSEAFAEDPVRILRLARFAARFAEFTVAAPTMALMRAMVEAGEVDALVPERVWQELARGLMERTPSRMLAVLRDCGALARILPELDASSDAPRHAHIAGGTHVAGARMAGVIDRAAARELSLPTRFAALMQALDAEPIQAACKRLRVPSDCRDLAVMTARERDTLANALALPAENLVTLFERCDGFRKPERFAQMLLAAACEAAQPSHAHAYPQGSYLLRALDAARAVNAGEVAARCADDKAKIPHAVHAARVAAVEAILDAIRD